MRAVKFCILACFVLFGSIAAAGTQFPLRSEGPARTTTTTTDAPAGFDNQTNGFLPQTTVDAVDDSTLLGISFNQPSQSGGLIHGQAIFVPITEAPGVSRVGRFGWKDQQASLLSFSADAYLNEMGVTTPMAPTENTSNGNS